MSDPPDLDAIRNPAEARLAMRRGRWTGPTTYKLPGYVQCNLVALPGADVDDFLLYCRRNPRACPVVDVTEAGAAEPRRVAPGADLRTDLPRYCVFEHGRLVASPHDVSDRWRGDTVGVLLGSSMSIDALIERAGAAMSPQIWVLRTAVETEPAGMFRGKLLVTMRLFTPADAEIALRVTGEHPLCHGGPRHVGEPAEIGAELARPVYGEPLDRIPDGLVPVFWDCGVTPQQAALEGKVPWMVTHYPGHAFITDRKPEELSPGYCTSAAPEA